MFERFSREAREVVINAQAVAREHHSPKIDTRHLLAGLAASGPAAASLRATGVDTTDLARRVDEDIAADDLDGEALAALGIDLEAVSARADRLFGRGALRRAGRRPRGHIPFTADAKKTMELSLREAIRLQERTIDGRHLLLAVVRGDSAAKALLAARADLARLRTNLEAPEAESA
ncbi:Clp protease N-terminal domain-containing protein [Saccharopolyspora griseoalba]|uniref:Clp protease N-terminal domain-containing protein n=1 Tax=Saccharopolyspora griseoalba TaxID=1431848 RepID=A0ABW2LKZ4_9PSEU